VRPQVVNCKHEVIARLQGIFVCGRFFIPVNYRVAVKLVVMAARMRPPMIKSLSLNMANCRSVKVDRLSSPVPSGNGAAKTSLLGG
jgi:hypothetical protein